MNTDNALDINTNISALLTTDGNSLTLDEVEFLLSQTKTRGEYKPVITNFFESGDLLINMSERFPGKDAASLRNSINIRLKQDFPTSNYKLMVAGDKSTDGTSKQAVLLVNMDVYAQEKAAKTAATATADDSEQ